MASLAMGTIDLKLQAPEFYVLHLERPVPPEVIANLKQHWRDMFAPDPAPRLIVIPAGARLCRSDGLPINDADEVLAEPTIVEGKL